MNTNNQPDTVRVSLGERSYDIKFHSDLESLAAALAPHCPEAAVVLTNDTIWNIHGQALKDALASAGIMPQIITIGDGEKFKTVETTSRVWDEMVASKLSRRTAVIAFGGGVIGDLAGFVAATFLRGVTFIQIPTTLVAMVDSSVGGKTGVDHPLGKNLIGAFHQPRHVGIYTPLLHTLDDHNLRGGLAEVIKYGVIYDPEYFTWLEQNISLALRKDVPALNAIVRRSCEIKADVVAQDEFELTGVRAILNYGHTFGHAIESLTNYQQIQFHGQGVAIGMCCAADLAVTMGMLQPEDAARIENLIKAAELPTHLSADMDVQAIYERMFSDKKVAAGKLRFILPTRIGEVKLVSDISQDQILETLRNRQG